MAKTKKKAAKKQAKKKPAKKAAKAKKVLAIPKGYHAITPYLVVDGAGRALDWYRDVFGAKERMRMPGQGGKIMHSEIVIGDSTVMMADTQPPMFGPTDSGMCLYVKDCDAVYERAISAGATVLQPMEDKFYGDRMGTVRDPFGQKWTIGTHIEDVSPKEMQKRMAAMQPPPGSSSSM